MSSGASDNAIRIPVEIVLDKTTQQLAGLRRTAETEGRAAASALQRSLAETERVAERTSGAMVRQQATLRETFRGTGQAVAGFQQGLLLLGSRGSPAIGALTTALSGLLATGLNPVALAIGGAAGLISLFHHLSTSQTEATEAAKQNEEATNRHAEAFERLRDAVKGLGQARTEIAAKSAGIPVEEEAARQAVKDAQGAVDFGEAFRPVGRSGMDIDERVELAQDMAIHAETMKRLREELAIAETTLATVTAIRLERERAAAKPELPGETTGIFRPSFLSDMPSTMSPFQIFEPTLAERNAAAAEQLAQMARDARQTTFAREGVPSRRFVSGPTDLAEASEEIRRIQEATAEGTAKGLADAAKAPEAASELERSIEGSVAGGLSAAFMNPDNWRSGLATLAMDVQRALSQSVASSIVGSFSGGTGIAGALASAFGAGGGGEAAPPPVEGPIMFSEPAFGKRSFQPDQPIVVVNVADEATADGILAKASSSGARAVLVKGSGGGVSRGSIPPRRRR